jgi:hypothetical protein
MATTALFVEILIVGFEVGFEVLAWVVGLIIALGGQLPWTRAQVKDGMPVLLHASAVSRKERTAVLAGLPGAGKSTSARHLVEAGFQCLSNDRVLAKPMPNMVEALGYPKQPASIQARSSAIPGSRACSVQRTALR